MKRGSDGFQVRQTHVRMWFKGGAGNILKSRRTAHWGMFITLGVTLKLPFTSGFTHLHPHLLLSYTISRDLIFMVCPEGRLVAGGHHGRIDAGRHVELDGQQDIGDHRLGRVLRRLNMAPVQWGVLKKPWIFTTLSDIWLKLGFLVVCPKWWINNFNLNI